MSPILIRLSEQLDAFIPQMFMFAFARKLLSYVARFVTFAARCSTIWSHERVIPIRRYYAYVQYCTKQIWSACYIMLVAYVVYDCLSNVHDLTNCRRHSMSRPIGIYCAVSLVCFVFTTKLSVATMSIVVLVCAKNISTLTGLACVINFLVWADVGGTSVAMSLCATLSALMFAFCGEPSSGALCMACVSWIFVWAWRAVVASIFRSLDVSKKVKHE